MAALAKFKVGEGGKTTRPAIVRLADRFIRRGARAMAIFPFGSNTAYLAVDGLLAEPQFRGVRDSLVVMGGEAVDAVVEGVDTPFPDGQTFSSSGRPYSD